MFPGRMYGLTVFQQGPSVVSSISDCSMSPPMSQSDVLPDDGYRSNVGSPSVCNVERHSEDADAAENDRCPVHRHWDNR